MASRNIDDLKPELALKYREFLARCQSAGLDVIITCTSRTVQEQHALYAQGRSSLSEVNRLRAVCGLGPITEQANTRCVTWTMQSKHLVDLTDYSPDNDKSSAFDFAVKGADGHVVWDLKADVNDNDVPDYTEAGRIAEALGLQWGGRWERPDYPHIQLPA